MSGDGSERMWAQAQQVLAAGVSSPVRSFARVGGTPRFFARGAGSRLWDVDGREYLDYVAAWGPLILGHAPAPVARAIAAAASDGWAYGAPTEREVRLAQEVRRRMPSLERVRFVNSGTEATMSALRLARAFTGRAGLVKFEGAYHGHADPFLSKAGSGLAATGHPDSAGVPPEAVRSTYTLPYNDLAAVESLLRARGPEIAAVIVEPVAGNMGVVPPREGFLAGLREACDRTGTLLVFDEVITGFRLARGGAQERYGVLPDLTTLGKILGGGLPLAAFGGREDVMRLLAPGGPVYQAGTMSGNPVAVAAGQATLDALDADAYATLESRARTLANGLEGLLGGDAVVPRAGSMMSVFFGVPRATEWSDVARSQGDRYVRLFHRLLSRGVYLPPSPYEAHFVGLAHSREDLRATLAAWTEAWSEARPQTVTA